MVQIGGVFGWLLGEIKAVFERVNLAQKVRGFD